LAQETTKRSQNKKRVLLRCSAFKGMTERFYPIGLLKNEEDAFKSTYTMQNEMRSFHRSAYPPGYAGHEPGVRDKHGYASPGPHAWRLSDPDHALTEDVGSEAPRKMQAVTKSKAHDHSVFHELDLPIRQDTLRTQATTTISPDIRATRLTRSMSSTRADLSALSRKKDPITHLEDERFTYFVPQNYSNKRRELLFTRQVDLLKLDKKERVTGANPGEGTGFRTQGAACGWWPSLDADPEISSIQRAYRRPPFHRSASATFMHTF